ELTYHTDTPGVGGPYSEHDAPDTIHHARMRAEVVVQLVQRALTKEVQVVVRDLRTEGVWVAPAAVRAITVLSLKQIIRHGARAYELATEEPFRVGTLHLHRIGRLCDAIDACGG